MSSIALAMGSGLAEIGFSEGYLLMPLLAFLLRDWRWYLRSIGFMGVLYIPYFWLIDELE